MIMMILGTYQFKITTAAYQELSRVTEYRWQAQDVFGQLPALQYTGPGSDSITLDGYIFPEYAGGDRQLDIMRRLADEGQPQRLIAGTGRMLGRWVIEKIQEKQTVFAREGQPKRQDFTLQIRRYD